MRFHRNNYERIIYMDLYNVFVTTQTHYQKPVRMAVIGCGNFGQKRIEACLSLPKNIELCAIGDTNQKQADDTSNRFENTKVVSISDILNNEEIEAVIIAVPNVYHADLIMRALRKGKHVLCEKPIATTVKDAQKIVRAQTKYKKIVKVGSNHRYFASVQKALKIYEKGDIGEIVRFSGSIGNDGTRIAHTWFWNKHIAGGGTYIDNGSHLLDIARMFMGDFSTCFGHVSTLFWKKSEVEDYGTGIFTTHNGAIATITASRHQLLGYMSFEIWGTRGYIGVNTHIKEKLTVTIEGGKEKIYSFGGNRNLSYQDELRYFAAAIRGNTEIVPSANDALAVLKMVNSVYLSSARHKRIRI
jgi:predicted dehydrogenase